MAVTLPFPLSSLSFSVLYCSVLFSFYFNLSFQLFFPFFFLFLFIFFLGGGTAPLAPAPSASAVVHLSIEFERNGMKKKKTVLFMNRLIF